MKKSLLTFCLGLVALGASAEVYTFIAADTPSGVYTGEGQCIVLPEGFYTDRPVDRKPSIMTSKAMVSDQVMLKEYMSVDAKGDTVLVANGSKVDVRNYVTSATYRWYERRTVRITPAPGTTVTKIKVRAQASNYCGLLSIVKPGADKNFEKVADFVKGDDGLTQEWNGSMSEAFDVAPDGQCRCNYIEITTTGTSTQVNLPVSSKTFPVIAAGEKIELTSTTPGAKIYYTVSYDGTEQPATTESTLYTAPFALEKDAIVRAIAVKDGMATSFPVYYEYYVVNGAQKMATFDFSNYTTLKKDDGTGITIKTPAAGSTTNVNLKTLALVDNDVVLNCEGTPKNVNLNMSDAFNCLVELRPAQNSIINVIAPEGSYLMGVYIQGSKIQQASLLDENQPGEYAACLTNSSKGMWRPKTGEKVSKVSFTFGKDVATWDAQYVNQIYALIGDGSSTGVDGVAADMVDENAPVEYFNLQGVRVVNPANGIYIKRQGSKVTKVLVK